MTRFLLVFLGPYIPWTFHKVCNKNCHNGFGQDFCIMTCFVCTLGKCGQGCFNYLVDDIFGLSNFMILHKKVQNLMSIFKYPILSSRCFEKLSSLNTITLLSFCILCPFWRTTSYYPQTPILIFIIIHGL